MKARPKPTIVMFPLDVFINHENIPWSPSLFTVIPGIGVALLTLADEMILVAWLRVIETLLAMEAVDNSELVDACV